MLCAARNHCQPAALKVVSVLIFFFFSLDYVGGREQLLARTESKVAAERNDRKKKLKAERERERRGVY